MATVTFMNDNSIQGTITSILTTSTNNSVYAYSTNLTTLNNNVNSLSTNSILTLNGHTTAINNLNVTSTSLLGLINGHTT